MQHREHLLGPMKLLLLSISSDERTWFYKDIENSQRWKKVQKRKDDKTKPKYWIQTYPSTQPTHARMHTHKHACSHMHARIHAQLTSMPTPTPTHIHAQEEGGGRGELYSKVPTKFTYDASYCHSIYPLKLAPRWKWKFWRNIIQSIVSLSLSLSHSHSLTHTQSTWNNCPFELL